jgi:hypothetical protein
MNKKIATLGLPLGLSIAVSNAAAAAGRCEFVATQSAQAYASEKMGLACAMPHAKILTTSFNYGRLIFLIDLQCGPDVPENHFQHVIQMDSNTCKVLGGGPGDA